MELPDNTNRHNSFSFIWRPELSAMVRDWPRDTFSRQQPFQCFSPGTTPRQQQQQPFPADRYGTAPNQRQPFPPDQYSLESSTTSRIQHTPELSRRQPLMVQATLPKLNPLCRIFFLVANMKTS